MTSVHPAAADAGREPSLVFIHGFLDGAAVWNDVVQALGARAADALCVNLPGMGERSGERGPFNLDGFAEDVAQQVGALERPVVLVGHSMGAQVAEMVAGDLASQVRALVLLTPVPLAGTGMPDDMMQPFRTLGGNPGAQRDLRRHLSVNLDGDRLETLGRMGDAVDPASVGVFADLWNRGHALGASHSRFTGPVLIVRGEGDSFVTADLVDNAVAPRFDAPDLACIGNAGHWAHVEQPESFAKALGEFLSTVDHSAGAATAQQGWTRAFEQKSSDAFAEAFAADIVLEASTLAKPVAGAELVKAVMGTASRIYEALAFTHQSTSGPRSYLEWEAQAFGGEKLSGITVLTRNEEGKIVRAAIHHRPLGGALKFSAELGRRLQGRVDASHFYGAD
ncbi:Pimeloyl-ACP methyl ester carboxylesterase [Variovorax sp. HW608]|uniref:alpha/beta fold hydrolase n=1 Tax=Variovorax sp. HW608 TaxID=1034889 RepID=UPI00081F7556|nr:alpha/beta hydrolase [Variovorax sp. HW608]SCK32073.1 Pimeloyl-ACP methyl ester carboxylesterase [Variovorax sp. HW608]